MTSNAPESARVTRQAAQALLELIEADRASQCAAILGEAGSRAAALRAQARTEAHALVRQAFAEQRVLWHERIAAAQARLATQRRLHQQQRHAALLRLAWAQLPAELLALWKAADTRAAWVAKVLAAARDRLPPGAWRIVHAPDWPQAEQQPLMQTLAAELGQPARFEPDAGIEAGLKIVVDGNRVDGSLAGLLADRAAFDARLLRRLEGSS